MTMRSPLTVLVLSSVLLAACGDDGDEVDDDDLAGRTFLATSLDGDQSLVEGTELTLTFVDDDLLAAVAGCNTMRGPFDVENGVLEVDALAQTLMACPPELQAQDEWVAAFLASGPSVGLDGDELTLATDDLTITFVDRESAATAAPLDETAWAIVSLDGPDGSLTPPDGAYLDYDDGTLGVFTGCNRGSAGAEVDDGTVTIGPMALSLIACEPDLAEWEAALVGFLQGTLGYEADGDTLVLTKGDQTLVVRPLR